MMHTGSVAEVQDKKKRLANHRNPLEEFSICPVCTGMSLKKKLFVSVGEDPPRMHGDEPIFGIAIPDKTLSALYARG